MSGYMLESALTGGIVASGADVYLMHVTTTPSVSFTARRGGFDAAIMISASHNPYFDNGIKLISGVGEKLDGEVTELAEDYLDGAVTIDGRAYTELPYATRAGIGRVTDYIAGRDHYVDYLISAAYCPLRGMRIGLDCANGSAWQIARAVFEALGASVEVIGDAPDGENINAGVGSTQIAPLQSLVTKQRLEVGFAFDGDADRCIAVDENGRVVDGDGIMYLSALYMKDEGMLPHDTVVGTVMSNSGMEHSLEERGISLIRTPVGDRYVWQRMLAGEYALGGEASGHIIYARYAPTGDGILTALRVLEVMHARRRRLSELVKDMVHFPQRLTAVHVKDPRQTMGTPRLMEAIHEAELLLSGRGRVLVRESGTEPVVRIMCETDDEGLCDSVCGMLEACVKEIETQT